MSNEASQKDVDHEKEKIDLLNEVDLKRLNENGDCLEGMA